MHIFTLRTDFHAVFRHVRKLQCLHPFCHYKASYLSCAAWDSCLCMLLLACHTILCYTPDNTTTSCCHATSRIAWHDTCVICRCSGNLGTLRFLPSPLASHAQQQVRTQVLHAMSMLQLAYCVWVHFCRSLSHHKMAASLTLEF